MTLDHYRNRERDYRMENRILYLLCLFMLAVALYAAHQCAKANEAAAEWQHFVISKGLGDGLK